MDRADGAAVPGVARRQAGVFTRQQALEAGWTPGTLRHRLASGSWIRVAGAALAARTEPTAYQYATAAWLTWPSSVISHRTAAVLHGFPVTHLPGADVTTGQGHRSRRLLRAHAVPLDVRDTVRRGPLVLTTPIRTALDCLATMDVDEALDLWAWLSTRQVVGRSELEQAVRDRLRRHGTPRLARLAELTRTGAASAAEHRLHELLLRAGIRGWVAGARVHDGAGLVGVVDLLFAEERVIVEVDGFRAHAGRATFVDDRRRQNRLVMAGYVILRFTWDDLTSRPADVLDAIRRALAASHRRSGRDDDHDGGRKVELPAG